MKCYLCETWYDGPECEWCGPVSEHDWRVGHLPLPRFVELVLNAKLKPTSPRGMTKMYDDRDRNGAFQATHHGFHMSFRNGYTISVQWGPENYTENRRKPLSECRTSKYAEVLVWHIVDRTKGSRTIKLDTDCVAGWQTSEQVARLIAECGRSAPDEDAMRKIVGEPLIVKEPF